MDRGFMINIGLKVSFTPANALTAQLKAPFGKATESFLDLAS